MKIADKYRHIGYSHPTVGKGWKPIVEQAIIDIEKEMWPRWIPMFIKRWIHKMATGNKVHHVRNRFFMKIRDILTHKQMIAQIKDKFAFLCIYRNVYPDDKIQEIIKQAEQDCLEICEFCGRKHSEENKVKRTAPTGNWLYNICEDCIADKNYIRKTWE